MNTRTTPYSTLIAFAALAFIGLCGSAKAQTTLYWEGSTTGITGGASNLIDQAALNWNPASDGSGTKQAFGAGSATSNAVFAGTGGNVSLTTTLPTFGDFQVNSTGYVFGVAASTTLNLSTFSGSQLSTAVIQNGTATADTLTLGVASGTANFTGTMQNGSTGSLGLTKSGAGTLVLGGANTYSGATAINGGTVQISAANNIGDSSATNTIAFNGGTLDSTANTYDLGANRAIALTGAGTIQVDAGTLTVSGNITGAGGLTKKGGGTLILSGTNTLTGGTLLLYANGGTLELNGDYSTTGATLAIQNSTFLSAVGQARTWGGQFAGLANAASAVVFNGSQNLTFSNLNAATSQFMTSGINAALANTSSGAVLTFAGTSIGIAGNNTSNTKFDLSATSANIIVSAAITDGSGTATNNSIYVDGNSAYNVTFSGANTFSGSLVINGNLNVATMNDNSTNGVFGNSTNAIQFNNYGSQTSALNFTGTTSASSNKSFILPFGHLNTANINVTSTGAMTLSGGISSTSAGTGNTLAFGGDGTGGGVMSGIISNGSSPGYTVNKNGASTWSLSGINTYTGATTVTGGTLKVGNASALGFGGIQTTATNGTTVSNGFTLDLNGTTGINEPITLNGTGIGGNGALVNNSGTAARIENGIAGIQLPAATTGSGYSTAPTVNFSGAGSGATATATLGVTTLSFTINGGTTVYSAAPTVAITGGNGATATAVLSGGTSGTVTGITITSAGTGFSGTPNISFTGGTVTTAGTNPTGTGNANQFTISGVSMTAAGSGYTGTPTYTFSSGNATAGSLTLSSVTLAATSSIGGTGDIAINAVVSGGANGLTKVGSGTLTLAGANTYTGATAVNAGTLSLSGGSMAATAVTVAAAASTSLKIGGSYTIGTSSGGTLTVNGGLTGSQGTLNLVDGTVNTLTLANNSATDVFTIGSTTASTNSILNMEVGAAGSDKIVVGTGASLIKVNVTSGGTGGTPAPNAIAVNITGLGGLTGATQTLISAGGVGTTSATRASFASGFVLGTTSGSFGGYTVTLSSDATHLNLTETLNGASANAYYNGGAAAVSGQGGTTAFNSFVNGNTSTSNFGTGAGGTGNATGLVGGTTNVTFDTNIVSPLSTSLGQDLAINSLALKSASAISIGGANTLTINATTANSNPAGNGITVAAGAGNNTIGSKVALGNNQTWTVTDTATTLTASNQISGGFTLTKAGAGKLTLSGANTYTGSTLVTSGTLVVNGSVASSTVNVSGGATLGGSGTMGNATLGGAGQVGPGNSPGILKVSQVDPTGGLAFNFEYTNTGAPAWNTPAASGNDVLRLSNATTPFTASLTSGNALNFYLDVAAITISTSYQGGFFTDLNSNFLANVQNATKNFYVYGDGSGTHTYNGVNYYTLTEYNAHVSGSFNVTLGTFQVASANFADGTVSNGWVTDLSAVPEPATWALLAFSLTTVMVLRRRRNS